MQVRHHPGWKQAISGACVTLSLAGWGAVWLPPTLTGMSVAAEASRMLEGAAPLLLLLNTLILLLLFILGMRRLTLIGGVVLLMATGTLAARVIAISQSQADSREPVALRLIWWNVFRSNPRSPDVLAQELIALNADVVILGETLPLQPVWNQLTDAYPYHMGCTGSVCDMAVLSRLPLSAPNADFDAPVLGTNGWFGYERLAAFQVQTPQGALTLIGMHQTKGWYGAALTAESHQLRKMLTRTSGPLVLAGDFNAPPWGKIITDLALDNDLLLPWPPVATWPADAAPLGLPIDHVFSRDGAKLVRVAPLDPNMGSNHVGLWAEIALSPPN